MKKNKLSFITLLVMLIFMACEDKMELNDDSKNMIEGGRVSKGVQSHKLYYDRIGDIIGDGFVGHGYKTETGSIRPTALQSIETDIRPSNVIDETNFRLIERSSDLERFYSNNLELQLSASSLFSSFSLDAQFKSRIEGFVTEQDSSVYACGEVIFTTGSVFLKDVPKLSDSATEALDENFGLFETNYSDMFIDESTFGVKACYLYRYSYSGSTTYTKEQIRAAVKLKISAVGDASAEAEIDDTSKSIINSLSVQNTLVANIGTDDFEVREVNDYDSFLLDLERLKQYVRENAHKIKAIERKLRPYNEALQNNDLITKYSIYEDCSVDYNLWSELKENIDEFKGKELSVDLKLELEEATEFIRVNMTKSLYCDESISPDMTMFNDLIERANNYILSSNVITTWISSFTQGWNNTSHVRTLADVNGDGKEDIVGFHDSNVYVSFSNGSGFDPSKPKTSSFTQSWYNSKHVRTMADVNGDGKDDIIGFHDNEVYVAMSAGSSFSSGVSWLSQGFAYNDGWRTNKHERLLGDVNGDGKADIVGFHDNEIYVATSTGGSFNSGVSWLSQGFAYNDGWNNLNHVRVLADVNGDGKADIVGFHDNEVYVAISTGKSFNSGVSWLSQGFANNDSWRKDRHLRTVSDVNGDGKADIVGFHDNEVYVAISDGNSFINNSIVISDGFGYYDGWNIENHIRILGDVDGNGKADIVGFGDDSVKVLKSSLR